jgi:hypothetical protein
MVLKYGHMWRSPVSFSTCPDLLCYLEPVFQKITDYIPRNLKIDVSIYRAQWIYPASTSTAAYVYCTEKTTVSIPSVGLNTTQNANNGPGKSALSDRCSPKRRHDLPSRQQVELHQPLLRDTTVIQWQLGPKNLDPKNAGVTINPSALTFTFQNA